VSRRLPRDDNPCRRPVRFWLAVLASAPAPVVSEGAVVRWTDSCRRVRRPDRRPALVVAAVGAWVAVQQLRTGAKKRVQQLHELQRTGICNLIADLGERWDGERLTLLVTWR